MNVKLKTIVNWKDVDYILEFTEGFRGLVN